jgi:hypothetical protein
MLFLRSLLCFIIFLYYLLLIILFYQDIDFSWVMLKAWDTPVHQGRNENTTEPEKNAATIP